MLLVFSWDAENLDLRLSDAMSLGTAYEEGIAYDSTNDVFYLQNISTNKIVFATFPELSTKRIVYFLPHSTESHGVVSHDFTARTQNSFGVGAYRNAYFSQLIVRKYSFPEPLASLGAEDGYPIAPTINTPNILSSSAIRWNFTDNSGYETGFRVYTNADAIATSSATANLTYLDETGLSENTQYTRYVKAYNSYGESASSSATSTYTLINAPSGLSFDTPDYVCLWNSAEPCFKHLWCVFQ